MYLVNYKIMFKFQREKIVFLLAINLMREREREGERVLNISQ